LITSPLNPWVFQGNSALLVPPKGGEKETVMTRKCVDDGQYGLLWRRLDEVARRVDEGTIPFDKTMRVLQAVAEGHYRLEEGSAAQTVHLIWKTIQLGLHQSADEYRKAIKSSGMRISDYVNDLLNNPAFTVMLKKCEVKLVMLTVAELGFPNGATSQEIYDKAKKRGSDLCPAEVGPALRLAYEDQPNGEWVIVAMEPITDSDGFLGVFGVGHDGDGRWLRTLYGSPGARWGPGDRWVFLCK